MKYLLGLVFVMIFSAAVAVFGCEVCDCGMEDEVDASVKADVGK